MGDVPHAGVYEKDSLDLRKVFSQVLDFVSDGRTGAVAFFVGVVKSSGSAGKDVEVLEMESYVEHANQAIERICDEVVAEYGLNYAGVWHLVGRFGLGEAVVLVAVCGRGRKEVLAALPVIVERYKREPALFKKEVYIDGTHQWIEGA
ncbi:Molybdopterin synthase catalytic subunit [archaeon HR01]|nr:Molybdopterin synthase catalytic subunit [archaeon HR01]